MVGLKTQVETLTARQTELKSYLTEAIDQYGVETDNGHIVLDIGDPESGIGSIQKQKRVSAPIDAEVAKPLLEAKGLWEQCTVEVREINEDEIMGAYSDGLLTEEDIAIMFPKKVSYAFLMNKG